MSDFLQYQISGVITDGSLISPKMRNDFERAYVSVLFYTDSEFTTQVIPTGGSMLFTASETGFVYGTIPNGVIDVSSETYTRPNFSGSVERVKATATGITGASHYVATISRYEG